ncbi:lytic polysaccharide monooxygenase [Pseudomonas putida]
MRNLPLAALACLATTAALQASAAPIEPLHGAMEVPAARQYLCYNAQDYYWPVNGSDIKSPGCKAAYQHVYKKFGDDAQQATYQFNQWHEVSKNVTDYRNMEAVKKAIPDGQLCSAGNHVKKEELTSLISKVHDLLSRLTTNNVKVLVLANDKSGLDVPAAWATQELKKDADNKAHMRYKIMAPHNPSYWEFYVSKADYDPAKRALNWDDLELVQTLDDVAPKDGYYEMDVDLKEHTGKRVIYSRWQRVDAAGEGFYNCSDVNIVSSK